MPVLQLTLANRIVGGAVKVSNSGKILQTGTVTFGDGSGKTPTIGNAKTGIYNFTSDASPEREQRIGLFYEQGASGENGRDLNLEHRRENYVNNAGTIQIATGAIAFNNALNNTGTIRGNGTIVINGATTLASGSIVKIANSRSSSTPAASPMKRRAPVRRRVQRQQQWNRQSHLQRRRLEADARPAPRTRSPVLSARQTSMAPVRSSTRARSRSQTRSSTTP